MHPYASPWVSCKNSLIVIVIKNMDSNYNRTPKTTVTEIKPCLQKFIPLHLSQIQNFKLLSDLRYLLYRSIKIREHLRSYLGFTYNSFLWDTKFALLLTRFWIALIKSISWNWQNYVPTKFKGACSKLYWYVSKIFFILAHFVLLQSFCKGLNLFN